MDCKILVLRNNRYKNYVVTNTFEELESLIKIQNFFKQFPKKKVFFSCIINNKIALHNIQFKYFYKVITKQFIEFENPKILLTFKVFY